MPDDFDYSSDDITPRQPDQPQPWWNNSDVMGGIFATFVTLAVGVLILGGAIKLVTMMF